MVLALMLLWQTVMMAQDRFPRPEFESGYEYPEHQLPLQRAVWLEYVDVAVLIAALSVAAWLALKKRSRNGLVWLAVFSLAYFGFYREGCICSVGSVQNVALALFNGNYTIPLTALLFFIIPLVFALLFGRVFCAGVCPLGAIQELTGFSPVKLPRAVESVMAAIPFIYLALTVLFAATGSQFIICRYDPFVGIFRLDAPFTMIVFGILLLLAGIFINRPYCRYLCPYGVLLNLFSRFSWRHLSITPAECTECRLCEDSCPYDVILPPEKAEYAGDTTGSRKRFLIYLVLIPLFTAAGSVIFFNLAPALSKVNPDVKLAMEIREEVETGTEATSLAAVAFKESGSTEEELFTREMDVIKKFRKASPWAGAFLGLALGIGLVSLTIRSSRTGYSPHRGKCYSCGKCFRYCPVQVKKDKI
ncbi:MAG: 4Fe-4S binding protein [Bacteroidales bacterium]|nr:4Fe-4S binding protein [Bacteroidales bacterium]MBN2632083.1 4Fe-4S binding protein [Bacteroidales bacterium]